MSAGPAIRAGGASGSSGVCAARLCQKRKAPVRSRKQAAAPARKRAKAYLLQHKEIRHGETCVRNGRCQSPLNDDAAPAMPKHRRHARRRAFGLERRPRLEVANREPGQAQSAGAGGAAKRCRTSDARRSLASVQQFGNAAPAHGDQSVERTRITESCRHRRRATARRAGTAARRDRRSAPRLDLFFQQRRPAVFERRELRAADTRAEADARRPPAAAARQGPCPDRAPRAALATRRA